jgi:hypothetical protein
VLIIGDAWIEFVLIENGSVVKSIVKTRDNALFPHIINEIPGTGSGQTDDDTHIFCDQSDASIFKKFEDNSFRLHIFEKEFTKINVEKFSLFNHLSPDYKRRKYLLGLLGFFSFIALAVLMFEYRTEKYRQRQNIILEQEILNKKIKEEDAELEHLEQLKVKYQELINERLATPYEIIEIISQCLNSETSIITETIRENFFQFEANAPDALDVLKSFEENDQIRFPVIQQIYPTGKSERFIINAAVVPKVERIPANISRREQINVLEEMISRLESDKSGERNYTPSLFGVSIRSVLAKWGCNITSYQYIHVEGSREVEFAVHAESQRFFAFLQEAIQAANGWQFKLIQIRNLSPLNMLDIIFRVTGRIEMDDDSPHVISDDISSVIPVALTEITKNYYTRPAITPIPSAPIDSDKDEPVQIPVKPEKAAWIDFIGIVGDSNGTQFIYVKDRRNNKVIRLTPDIEEDQSYLDLQNGIYEARIDGKSYELRRNQ